MIVYLSDCVHNSCFVSKKCSNGIHQEYLLQVALQLTSMWDNFVRYVSLVTAFLQQNIDIHRKWFYSTYEG